MRVFEFMFFLVFLKEFLGVFVCRKLRVGVFYMGMFIGFFLVLGEG